MEFIKFVKQKYSQWDTFQYSKLCTFLAAKQSSPILTFLCQLKHSRKGAYPFDANKQQSREAFVRCDGALSSITFWHSWDVASFNSSKFGTISPDFNNWHQIIKRRFQKTHNMDFRPKRSCLAVSSRLVADGRAI